MSLLISCLILVMAAVVSIFLSHVFTQISVSYLSIFMGAIIFLVPPLQANIFNFNANIFIGLIVAPLLFFEGQATPLNAVGRQLKQILLTTIFLVVLCLLFAGFGIWLAFGISMPLAFILAAISTPTDATALDSVSNGLKGPLSEGPVLKLESLFNDASGIILLNMTTLWYTNGYINYLATFLNFIISAVGGVLFGFAVAWMMILFRQILMKTVYNSLNAQILLYITTPFVLYFSAQALNVSGIIAVVCAGLVHNAEAERSKLLSSSQIHFGLDLQDMITEIFNSIVFVMLGFLFFKILASENSMRGSLTWLWIGILLYIINSVIRYLFAIIHLKYNRRSSWIFSLGGARGAITLALAYTLVNFWMAPGELTLVLLSESVLIILSLLVPTVVFRFLLRKTMTNEEALQMTIDLRGQMVKRAVKAVQKMYLPETVKNSVIFDINTQKQDTKIKDFSKAWLDVVRRPGFEGDEKELETRAFMTAFKTEREYLDMMSQSDVQYRDCVFQLYNEVLLAESLVIQPLISAQREDRL